VILGLVLALCAADARAETALGARRPESAPLAQQRVYTADAVASA